MDLSGLLQEVHLDFLSGVLKNSSHFLRTSSQVSHRGFPEFIQENDYTGMASIFSMELRHRFFQALLYRFLLKPQESFLPGFTQGFYRSSFSNSTRTLLAITECSSGLCQKLLRDYSRLILAFLQE